MKNIDIPYCELNKMKNCYLIISLTMFLLGSSATRGSKFKLKAWLNPLFNLADQIFQNRWI